MAIRNKAVLVVTLILAFGAAAQDSSDARREQAERELQRLLGEIAAIQDEIGRSRQRHRQEQEQLRRIDLSIQDANLEIRALDRERGVHENRLAELEEQRRVYLDSLDERLAQLAEQVRSLYRAGRQSRTRLVLNQDEPSRISRMLAYYEYVNRAQIRDISGLREALTRLDVMQASIDGELERLNKLKQKQQEILVQLQQQRAERAQLLTRITALIEDSESELAEMEANRRDLESLLERLSDVLSDIPEELGGHTPVAQLKGHLPMPIRGPVQHAFGQGRGTGLDWQGWLIAADAGAEVRAVAYGRVAFADWLRGYGLLLIIDHGDGYMTLYGHNQSLLHDAGEWVDAGEAISVVGDGMGDSQGVYFEIRRNGKALDPAAWLAR
ncbi:MAG: peptidoglycan DD-metalloendopeptidase family protein [Lysobacterales bacterium]|jgi:septal ring factor EnvC (AmiA/AmiB activator)